MLSLWGQGIRDEYAKFRKNLQSAERSKRGSKKVRIRVGVFPVTLSPLLLLASLGSNYSCNSNSTKSLAVVDERRFD